jgi:hypothetical protein
VQAYAHADQPVQPHGHHDAADTLLRAGDLAENSRVCPFVAGLVALSVLEQIAYPVLHNW